MKLVKTIAVLAAISLFSAAWAEGEVYWIGGSDQSWDNNVWSRSTAPGADDTAVFTNDYILVKIKNGHCASNVVFDAGSRIRFSRTNGGDQAAFGFKEINGGGKLELISTGLQANYASFSECFVSVNDIEIIDDTTYSSKVSWFDGGSTEGSRMTVNSRVSGTGKLELRGNVTIAGETTLSGSLKLESGSIVKKLVYANGGCNLTSDSAGTVEKVHVRNGILAYSSSALAAATGVTVGEFVLDGGTLSVGSGFAGTVASGDGSGVLFLDGEWVDADLVSLPSGILFIDAEDAANIDVRATIAGREWKFSIKENAGVYSLEAKGAVYNFDELDFSLMTLLSGQGSPRANKSINNNDIRLWDGEKAVTFSRGIGTHAPSRWFIKLGGKGVSLSVCAGVDYEAYGKTGSSDGKAANVKFIILDVEKGVRLAETGEMTAATPYEQLDVDLSGVETIELIMDSLDSTSWDHADWAGGVIVMEAGYSPVTKRENNANYWTGSGENDYWVTPENWEFGLPVSSATAAFDADATVRIGETGQGSTTPQNVNVSNVVVDSGCTLTIRPVAPEFWDSPTLTVQELNGGGKIQLAKVGLVADYSTRNECVFGVAEIEPIYVTRWNDEIDSWINGKTEEGKKLTVKSDLNCTGRISIYGNTSLEGDVIIKRGFLINELASATTVVYATSDAYIKGTNNIDSVGTISTVKLSGGTYDYATYAGKTWGLLLDGGAIDIGDGTVLGDSALELEASAVGGIIRYTAASLATTPAFPTGLTFAEGADITSVYVVAKDGDGAQKTYVINEDAGVYSLVEATATERVKWIGGGSDRNWTTAANWLFSAVPTATQTAVFAHDATVDVSNETSVDISNLVVNASVQLSATSEWGWANGPVINFQEISGTGKLGLKHATLKAANESGTARIACAELEIMSNANNDAGRTSDIRGPSDVSNAKLVVTSSITGVGRLGVGAGVAFGGDNSGFTGYVELLSVGSYAASSRYFDTSNSFFPNATTFAARGRIFVNFTEGTAKLGNVEIGESWGASLVMKHGANVTLEISSGYVWDSHNGDGFEVWTRDEGVDNYICYNSLKPASGISDGCAGLTIKKVGDGTLVYGVTKAHSLVVEGGHVEFTGENSSGDDAAVSVTVRAGASVGSAAARNTGVSTTVGGDVTVRHQFIFEPGAMVKQDFVATPVTEEQLEPVYEDNTFVSNIVHIVETGEYVYSMRKLTIAGAVDLANVTFGVTNPEALPAVTRNLSKANRFPVFAADSLAGAVVSENGGYAPEGTIRNAAWKFRRVSSNQDEIEFYPCLNLGMVLLIR